MGLFLPQPPAPDSDEEEDPEGAAAHRSRASIPMDAGEILSFLTLILVAAVYNYAYGALVHLSTNEGNKKPTMSALPSHPHSQDLGLVRLGWLASWAGLFFSGQKPILSTSPQTFAQ